MPFATLAPGTRLGRFQVQGVLGQGGMGVVYTALDVSAGRTVALKVLPPELAKDPRFVARFKREGEVAAGVAHPNVVNVHFHGKEAGLDVIALELVQGGSLKARLRRGALPWQEAVRFGIEIARGLGAIHATGLVHRDLKPENVLLDESGHAKVADFGLVTQDGGAQRLTLTGELLGTPEYMAPEQSESAKAVDHRADLYSLGCVLYALLVGRPPFDGSGYEVIARHVTTKPRPPGEAVKDLPPRLEWLVLRLLEKDPAKRPPSAGDVAAELEKLGGSEAAPAPRRLALAAGALVVALGAGGGAYLGLAGKPAPEVPPPPPPPPPAVDPVSYTEVDHAPRVEGPILLVGTRGGYEWRLSGGAYSAAFLPDGKRALVGEGSGAVRLFDLADGRELRLYATPTTLVAWIAISPDGKSVVVGHQGGVEPLRVFDVETGKQLGSLRGHDGTVFCVAWSPSGKRILSGGGKTNGYDYRLWDVGSGDLVRTMDTEPGPIPHGVAFLDEHVALSCSWGGGAVLWDLDTGQKLREIDLQGQVANGLSAAAAGKRAFLATRSGAVLCLDLASFEVRQLIATEKPGEMLGVAATSDGSGLVAVGYPGVNASDERLGSWADEAVAGWACAISADGKRLLTGHQDGSLRLWDMKRRAEISKRTAAAGPVVVLDRSGAVAVSHFESTVDVNRARPEATRRFPNPNWWTGKVALSEDTARLAIPRHFLEKESELLLDDTRTGTQLDRLVLPDLTGYDGVTQVVFSPDGKTLTAADSKGRISIYRTEGLILERQIPLPIAIQSIALLQMGAAWIAAGQSASGEWLVYMSPPPGSSLVPERPRGKHGAAVTATAGRDRNALSGDSAGVVKRWPVDASPERDLVTHKGPITALALSPDETLAATASTDGTVAIVPLSPGGLAGKISLVGGDYATALSFESSTRLHVGTARGIVMTFEVKPR